MAGRCAFPKAEKVAEAAAAAEEEEAAAVAVVEEEAAAAVVEEEAEAEEVEAEAEAEAEVEAAEAIGGSSGWSCTPRMCVCMYVCMCAHQGGAARHGARSPDG